MRESSELQRPRPPALQTSHAKRPSTSHRQERLTPTQPETPRPASNTSENESAHPRKRSGNKSESQNFVLTDPIAFRYLEEDSSTTVLDRRQELQGYECYIVEQWTTSRKHPTFVITTYTGDLSHTVVVGVLSVPTDESTWSPRLRIYFKALNQYHARRHETPLGILMVTTLSGFPSSLNVIPVPEGDLRKHRNDFFVNEDLKRLNCSGRVGMALIQPSTATINKFYQLYKTNDKIDFYKSVIELIKLCQCALMLFDKLEADYADGLLCDVTERAINSWWLEFGSDHYGIEPHDGILGPTTVAGLLGLLLGARNRLHTANAPVAKDAFDVEAMKRGIGAFQKQQKIEPRTRRLDRKTLDRLHKATQKAAEKERWAMPKAVKTTVAELSGRDLVTENAGRRDKAGIAEIETTDIDRFAQLVYGDRCKWLWLGKPLKKSRGGDEEDGTPQEALDSAGIGRNLILKSDEHGGFTWTPMKKGTVDEFAHRVTHHRDLTLDESNRPIPEEGLDEDEDPAAKMSVFKRATYLRDEAKSGLGKVKDAVGLRSHKSKPSVDDHAIATHNQGGQGSKRPGLRRAHTSPMSSPGSPDFPVQCVAEETTSAEHSERLNKVLSGQDTDVEEAPSSAIHQSQKPGSRIDLHRPGTDEKHEEIDDDGKSQRQLDQEQDSDRPSVPTTAEPSIAGSIYNGTDLNDALPQGPATEADFSNSLKRTVSLSQFISIELQSRSDHAFSRHLSFSLAEDSVLKWTAPDVGDVGDVDARARFVLETESAEDAKRIRHLVQLLQTDTVTWTQTQLDTLNMILEHAGRDAQTIEEMHQPQIEHVQSRQGHSEGVLLEDKDQLEEGMKEVEALAAKLDYEIDGLRSKVEDVEAGVIEFEKGVARVEERVVELEKESERRSAWGCIVS